jgi:CheY-like chemotaxis protein
MLTANALAEHLEASRQAGADRHLTKPITADKLLSALAELELSVDAAAREARRA